jgi:hypothetical protein
VKTFLYSVLAIAFGVSLIAYTEPIKRFTGSMDFAERALGSGGTYTFYKLLGIGIIVVTILWATGGINACIPNFLIGGPIPQN